MPILLQVPEFRGCVAHEFIQEFIQYSKIFNLTFYNQILNQFLTFFFNMHHNSLDTFWNEKQCLININNKNKRRQRTLKAVHYSFRIRSVEKNDWDRGVSFHHFLVIW